MLLRMTAFEALARDARIACGPQGEPRRVTRGGFAADEGQGCPAGSFWEPPRRRCLWPSLVQHLCAVVVGLTSSAPAAWEHGFVDDPDDLHIMLARQRHCVVFAKAVSSGGFLERELHALWSTFCAESMCVLLLPRNFSSPRTCPEIIHTRCGRRLPAASPQRPRHSGGRLICQ